jgi:hypothetical protein
MDLPFLYVIPRYFIYIALLAWLIVFIGLVRTMARTVLAFPGRRRRAQAASSAAAPNLRRD